MTESNQPPPLESVRFMETDEIVKWLEIASDEIETFWSAEARDYRPGVQPWAALEDLCVNLLIARY